MYSMVPRVSWGSMPPDVREQYNASACEIGRLCRYWKQRHGVTDASYGTMPMPVRDGYNAICNPPATLPRGECKGEGGFLWCRDRSVDPWTRVDSRNVTQATGVSFPGACTAVSDGGIWCTHDWRNASWFAAPDPSTVVRGPQGQECGVSSDKAACRLSAQHPWKLLNSSSVTKVVSIENPRKTCVVSAGRTYCTDDFENVSWYLV